MNEEVTNSSDQIDEPVGKGEYVVAPGDCLSSIAYRYGYHWRKLWWLPANSELRKKRRDPYVLRPEDRLHIPPRELKHVSAVTDQKHVYVRKGLPEKLRLVLCDENGKPRPHVRYGLTIDRKLHPAGESDAAGVIEISIPPNASHGELTVFDSGGEGEDFFSLTLGHLDPVSALTGVQGRLSDQGYDCGQVDGVAGPKTHSAISSFQQDAKLPVTGKLDNDTRKKLQQVHGF